MSQPCYRIDDILSEVFEAPVKYPYWKLYLPSNQMTAECVGQQRVGEPRRRQVGSAEGADLGDEAASSSGVVDEAVSRDYLERVLSRLEPGRYYLVCWANPGGHRNARALHFVKYGLPGQPTAPLAGPGYTPAPASAGADFESLLSRIDQLSARNRELEVERIEADRRRELDQLKEQIKHLQDERGDVMRWVEPLGRVLVGRLLPQLTPASAPAPAAAVAGVGAVPEVREPSPPSAATNKVEVPLSDRQIEELQDTVTQLVQRGGAQALEQLKALNRLDDATLQAVLSTRIA